MSSRGSFYRNLRRKVLLIICQLHVVVISQQLFSLGHVSHELFNLRKICKFHKGSGIDL